MGSADSTPERPLPASLDELRRWIQDQLAAPDSQKTQLVTALEVLFDRQRDLWQTSKLEAVQALSAGFADELGRLQEELQAKEQAVQNVARYFEGIVAGLTDRTHRDPKTRLLNFDWFMHRLEAFLAIEQRVRWCAAGVVDIARFKWFNDQFGHATGDRIIQRVARLLSEQTRSRDLLAQETSPADLHARFGGDEFTFLLPDLPGPEKGLAVASRFKQHVEQFPWSQEDARLADHPVRVDVGIVCLQLGPIDDRRGNARLLAEALIARADQLMYAAKHLGSDLVHGATAEVREGRLVDIEVRQADHGRGGPAGGAGGHRPEGGDG
jgi:diguanylate cyclase (GGDEF)-like protein